jgi:hypothetical protein
MKTNTLCNILVTAVAVLMIAATAMASSNIDTLAAGKANLQSAGALAFGPEGILLVGDSTSAAIFALDTADRGPGKATPVSIAGINEKIAAMLGTAQDQIHINDMAVNPISRKVYLSVSRGQGPDAAALILRTDSSGKLEELSLDGIKHSKVDLPNAPDPAATDRRGRSHRLEAITDLAYVDGKVIVAGLSNEEFASTLRSIPFPFETADTGASVEIFHGAHGRWETNSPVRTFVPYEIKAEAHILAAYTCTPLVKFPLAQLKPGTKVVGTTIAELGNRNRPLDMIIYQRDGQDYILMNNSSRGVMKMSTNKIDAYKAITEQTDITGLPYETIADLKGVEQLDRYDDANAMMLVTSDSGTMTLKSVALP